MIFQMPTRIVAHFLAEIFMPDALPDTTQQGFFKQKFWNYSVSINYFQTSVHSQLSRYT